MSGNIRAGETSKTMSSLEVATRLWPLQNGGKPLLYSAAKAGDLTLTKQLLERNISGTN